MTKDSVLPTAAVLVVEHSAAIRRLFEVVLREVADPLFIVADQEAARELLAAEPVDVVVLEPHGATEFSWDLLDDLTKSGIPVIIVTSRAEERIEAEARRRGAVAFVPKPFAPAALRTIICDLVNADNG
jgi:NtrC-family two-component system response regulator AlgB